MSDPMGGPKLRNYEEPCALDKPRGAHQSKNRPWGGTPSDGSITGGAPGGDDFVDKLPIRINGAKISVHSELSAGSNEIPSMELFKEGNQIGGKNPYERANGNFGGTTGEGTKSREGTKEHAG